MKKNIIINGNSITELDKLDEESIDLIFADPPYWMRTEGVLQRVEGTDFDGCDDEWDKFESLAEYELFTRQWLTACKRVLKPNGSIWVIGGMQCIHTIGSIMQELDYWIINDVIWHKKNPTPNFKGTRLNNSHETLIWATKTQNSKYTFNYKTAKELNHDNVTEDEFASGMRKQMGSVWKIGICSGAERIKDKEGNKLHNTQKPEELLDRIILISSKKGDLILDPFGGTMTTAVAAKRYGRDYIMIERDKNYCEYGKERLDKIEYEDSPISNAAFDIKPLRVSMEDMIREGYFITGESFSFKDGKPVAKLDASGKLIFNNTIMDMHTCAATARKVKAKRVNGFDYWHVIREGKVIPISEIREQYRKKVS